MSKRHPQILSTGRYVPARRLDNAEVGARLGQDVDAWLRKNVGITARHFMADDQVTSDLLTEASAQALARAGVAAADLDLIIIATDTPDYLSPATASVVQAKLGARGAGTFDVNCACAGWVTALDIGARHLLTEESARYVLVAGGYGMSRYIDWGDKSTCTLFADGAGAVVLGVGDSPGFFGTQLLARGEYHDALGIYAGGTSRPATQREVAENGPPKVQFVRKFPKTFNAENWPPLIEAACKKGGLVPSQVDLFIFTQLNLRTIEEVMGILGQPMDKTHYIMDKWGYTGSACIPMALDDAIHGGRAAHGLPPAPRPGDHVVLCASGGGLAMAASLWRWTAGAAARSV